MKSTKKSLLASGASLLLSAALLAGSTFAWFTDSVTNTGNVITAGNLNINAYAYDVDMTNGTQTVKIPGVYDGKEISFEAVDKGQNLKTDPQAIIDEKLWEPGKSNAKLLTVKNDGSLAAKVKVEFDVEDGGLMDALWFDFIQVKDGAATGSFQKKPMSDLAKLGSATEISVGAGGSVSFVLVYGMKEEAGNEYQDKTFSADVTVLAKQDTVEKDGFGSSDYDKNAVYSKEIEVTPNPGDNAVENGRKLREAIDNATANTLITVEEGTYSFEDALVATKPVTIKGNGDVVLDFSEAKAPVEGDYNTSAALVILSSNVTYEGVTVYGNSSLSSVVAVGLDNAGALGDDNNFKVSDTLSYDFEWAVNEFAPDYKNVYENVNFYNCTFALKDSGKIGQGLFLTCRYTVVKDCTFENLQATNAVVKIEEDHTKVLGSTFKNCTGTEIAEDWCGAQYDGDGNEYPGHDFCCKEGWNNMTGDAYKKHLEYAASMGWNHNAEE